MDRVVTPLSIIRAPYKLGNIVGEYIDLFLTIIRLSDFITKATLRSQVGNSR